MVIIDFMEYGMVMSKESRLGLEVEPYAPSCIGIADQSCPASINYDRIKHLFVVVINEVHPVILKVCSDHETVRILENEESCRRFLRICQRTSVRISSSSGVLPLVEAWCTGMLLLVHPKNYLIIYTLENHNI